MTPENALEVIRSRIERPAAKIGLILGSGLAILPDLVDGTAIDYSDLPGFPHAGVSGHNPKLVIGRLEGAPVAVLGGRAHYYETGYAGAMRVPLEVLAELGVETLVATNACGSLRADIPPGDLMLIADHINYSGMSPLIGEPTDRRFVNLTDAYDPSLRAALSAQADALNIPLKEGVYAWYSGPNFGNAGRDSGPEDPRCRCSGHVDGARGDPWPIPWNALRGGLRRDQHGRRVGQRRHQPRTHQGQRAGGGGEAGKGAAGVVGESRLGGQVLPMQVSHRGYEYSSVAL